MFTCVLVFPETYKQMDEQSSRVVRITLLCYVDYVAVPGMDYCDTMRSLDKEHIPSVTTGTDMGSRAGEFFTDKYGCLVTYCRSKRHGYVKELRQRSLRMYWIVACVSGINVVIYKDGVA